MMVTLSVNYILMCSHVYVILDGQVLLLDSIDHTTQSCLSKND